MDYSNHLFRVSSLGHIMPAAIFGKDVYKAAQEKQDALFGRMQQLEGELDAIANKTTLTAKKKEDQVEKASDAFYLQRRITEELYKNVDTAEISEGCKTHLMDVWIAHEYGRATKDIRSKYIPVSYTHLRAHETPE